MVFHLQAVSAQLRDGKSLYYVNEDRLRSAAPTLLITQNLCQVCGPAGNGESQTGRKVNGVGERHTRSTSERITELGSVCVCVYMCVCVSAGCVYVYGDV